MRLSLSLRSHAACAIALGLSACNTGSGSTGELGSDESEVTSATNSESLGEESETTTEQDESSEEASSDESEAGVFDMGTLPPGNPSTLCESGLYSDCESEVLAAGVREFSTAYTLWSDSATKRRWVLLPEGAQIDTSDMDFWHYPEGTKLWKEFTRDGTRVETRFLHKKEEGGEWYAIAYAWNEAQTETNAAALGAENVLGTEHDIPGFNTCKTCHEKQPDYVLGFSAIQLSHDDGGVTLQTLIDEDSLSDPPEAPFVLPGEGTPAQDALGYLHANCGGCHHEQSMVFETTPMVLRLAVDSLASVEETPTFVSTIGITPLVPVDGASALIEAGMPEASDVHTRMATLTPPRMPPVASELVDEEGLALVDAWITSLAP